jgi:hypothetical protein
MIILDLYYINYNRRKLRSKTSDLWTDVATVVRAVREEKESEEKESEEKDSGEKTSRCARR